MNVRLYVQHREIDYKDSNNSVIYYEIVLSEQLFFSSNTTYFFYFVWVAVLTEIIIGVTSNNSMSQFDRNDENVKVSLVGIEYRVSNNDHSRYQDFNHV